MEEKSRLNYGVTYKIALLVVAVVGVWELLWNDTTSNMIINFVFAGIVPGTDVILAPNTVIDIAAGVFAAGVLALIVKLLWPPKIIESLTDQIQMELPLEAAEQPSPRAVKLRHPILSFPTLSLPKFQLNRPNISLPRVAVKLPTMPAVSMPNISLSAPSITLPKPSKPSKPSLPTLHFGWLFSILTSAGSFLQSVGLGLGAAIVAAFKWIGFALRWTGALAVLIVKAGLRLSVSGISYLVKLGIFGLRLVIVAMKFALWALYRVVLFIASSSVIAYRYGVVFSKVAVRYSRQESIHAWRWLEPRLRRFDRWLQLQFRQQAVHLDMQIKRHENIQFMLRMSGQASDALQDVKPSMRRISRRWQRYGEKLDAPDLEIK